MNKVKQTKKSEMIGLQHTQFQNKHKFFEVLYSYHRKSSRLTFRQPQVPK